MLGKTIVVRTLVAAVLLDSLRIQCRTTVSSHRMCSYIVARRQVHTQAWTCGVKVDTMYTALIDAPQFPTIGTLRVPSVRDG